MRRLHGFVLMVMFAGAGVQALAGGTGMLSVEDKKGVDATLDGFASAWNRHDMDAYGALLTDDCEWVNVVGAYWPNKTAVMKAHRAYHATMFKNVSQHEVSRSVGEISPGVAIAVVTFDVDDYTTPDGRRMTGIRDRITYILVKKDAQWLIRSGHNTTIDPVAVAHDPNNQ